MERYFQGVIFLVTTPIIIIVFILKYFKFIDYRSAGQVLSLIPNGFGGILARRCWYKLTLESCGHSLTVDWMSVLENRSSRIGNNVYVGPRSSIGLVAVGDDVLISSSVSVVSGSRQHGTRLNGVPMRLQSGDGKVRVQIGSDVWIGAGALIAGDVASGSVVGMGSVVSRRLDVESAIWVGNPARLLRARES